MRNNDPRVPLPTSAPQCPHGESSVVVCPHCSRIPSRAPLPQEEAPRPSETPKKCQCYDFPRIRAVACDVHGVAPFPSGSASPSSERPAERSCQYCGATSPLIGKRGGWACWPPCESSRVSSPSSGGPAEPTHGAALTFDPPIGWKTCWRCHASVFSDGQFQFENEAATILHACRNSAPPPRDESDGFSIWNDGAEMEPGGRLALLLDWIAREDRTVVPFPLSGLQLLAARLSTGSAPRNEPDEKGWKRLAMQACRYLTGEQLAEASKAAGIEAHICGSAPRPQEGEAAALTDEDVAALRKEAAWNRSFDEGASPEVADTLDSIADKIAARLASPLPPRDERRAELDTALLDRMDAVRASVPLRTFGFQFWVTHGESARSALARHLVEEEQRLDHQAPGWRDEARSARPVSGDGR
jgi:hypothetical protein